MLERVSRGFLAGCVGTAVKTALNVIMQKAGVTQLSSLGIGTDVLLGKAWHSRHGVAPGVLGAIASMGIGGGYGSLAALIGDSRRGKRSWIVRGLQLGTVVFTMDMALGSRTLPYSVQGDVGVKDALWYYVAHLAYGLATSGLIELMDTDQEADWQLPANAEAMQWWVEVRPGTNDNRVIATK